jgi:hypothetical protein
MTVLFKGGSMDRLEAVTVAAAVRPLVTVTIIGPSASGESKA